MINDLYPEYLENSYNSIGARKTIQFKVGKIFEHILHKSKY